MASLRLLVDTVVLYNYVGEVNDEATYQETVFKRCYCPLNEGADLNMQGKKAKDSARLYLFDSKTIAVSTDGMERTYIPYSEWLKVSDKTPYWTLSDKGTDYFKKSVGSTKLRIVGFSHKQAGTRRMWHFEVDGQ